MTMIDEKFQRLEGKESQDIEKEWAGFRDTVLEVAEELLGTTWCKDRKKRTPWWNNAVKSACKKKAYLKWLQTRNAEDSI